MSSFPPWFEAPTLVATGERSEVYQTHDAVARQEVAIKVGLEPRYRHALFREYRHLSRFRHPNIVQVLDCGALEDGRPYFTMDWVRGQPLSRRHGIEVLAQMALQVTDVLQSLHTRGLLHRDLSPSNVLVAGEDGAWMARVLDAGLFCRVGSRPKPAGTLAYMAPEAVRGYELDGRSDLFALGAVLYELLLPEDGAHSLEQLRQRFNKAPPPPAELEPNIPVWFSDWVSRLIQPNRDARYPSAQVAADALWEASEFKVSRGPPRAVAERLCRGGAVSHRTHTLRRVRRFVRRGMARGRSATVSIEGALGVGKTPVMRELSVVFNLAGYHVLRFSAGGSAAAPVPAMIIAAETLSGDEELAQRLRDLLSERPDTATAWAARAATLLVRALGHRPTVLLVDDVDRAEPVVLEVLRLMGRESELFPLAMVMASDQRRGAMSLGRVLQSRARLTLRPLGSRRLHELVAQRVLGLQLPKSVLQRVVKDTGGLPSLAERTLAWMLVDGLVATSEGAFTFVGGRYRPGRHADTELISSRLTEVPPSHLKVLQAAAVLNHGITAERIADVSGLTLARVRASCAFLAWRELLVPTVYEGMSAYTLASRTLQRVVYRTLPPSKRQRLHDAAAGVADDLGGGRVEERVEHLMRGSNEEAAIDAAIEAGTRAAQAFAERRSVEYFARAFSRLPAGDARRGQVALRLGELFSRSGEFARADDWYHLAAEEALADGEAELGLAALSLASGAVEQACGYLSKLVPMKLREVQRARLLHLQGRVALHLGDAAACRRYLLEAIAMANEHALTRVRIDGLLDLARLERSLADFPSTVLVARQAMDMASQHGDGAGHAAAAALMAQGFLGAGRARGAERALSRGKWVAESNGDRLRGAILDLQWGNLELRKGRLTDALEAYGRCLDVARLLRAGGVLAACLQQVGWVRSLLGQLRPAVLALEEAARVAAANGHGALEVRARAELGRVLRLLGRLDASRAEVSAAREQAFRSSDRVAFVRACSLSGWLAAFDGDWPQADYFLDQLDDLLELIGDPEDRALLLSVGFRCAQLGGRHSLAVILADQFRALTRTAHLGHLEPLADAMRGIAGHGVGEPGALEATVRATRGVERMQQRLWFVELNQWLCEALPEPKQRLEHGVKAMETARAVVHDLPHLWRTDFLARTRLQALRTTFTAAWSEAQGLVTQLPS